MTSQKDRRVENLRWAGSHWAAHKVKNLKVSQMASHLIIANNHSFSGLGEAFTTDFVTPTMQSMENIHEEGLVDTLFANSLNPVACLFHVLFKGASIVSFVFLNAFLNEEILTFIIVVVFAAFDFWTVKNITGRLLVNLRWNSYIDQFGNEIYVYESDDTRKD